MDGYRKGGATPICTWSPAKSGSWDMLHVGLEQVAIPEVYFYDLSLRKAMDAARFFSLVDLSSFSSTCD